MYFEANVTRCTARKLFFFCSRTQDNTLPFVSKRVFRFGHKITSNFRKCQTIPRGEGFALTISELHNQAPFISLPGSVVSASAVASAGGDQSSERQENASRPGSRATHPVPCLSECEQSRSAADSTLKLSATSQRLASLEGPRRGGGNLSCSQCNRQLPRILIGIMYHWLSETISGPHKSQLIRTGQT